jgi:hypothetical protein
MVGVAFRLSTCFLERWQLRFMWRSQYFWSPTASLEHRHFLPSVRRHLPGSMSPGPGRNGVHPTVKSDAHYIWEWHKPPKHLSNIQNFIWPKWLCLHLKSWSRIQLLGILFSANESQCQHVFCISKMMQHHIGDRKIVPHEHRMREAAQKWHVVKTCCNHWDHYVPRFATFFLVLEETNWWQHYPRKT